MCADSPEELALEIDKQIHSLYKPYPVNLYAAGVEDPSVTEKVKQDFDNKLAELPKEARQYLLDMYANPVKNSNHKA